MFNVYDVFLYIFFALGLTKNLYLLFAVYLVVSEFILRYCKTR